MLRGAAYVALIVVALGAAAPAARGDEAVDAAIVLAADVSRSIDDEEFDLQRRGYAAAIVSDKLMEAIRSGPHGAIALAYVEWAGEGEQTIVVDWTVLRNSTDAREIRRRADRFAALLPRPHGDRLGARFRHGAFRRRRDRGRPQGDRRLRRRNQQPGPRRRRGARRGGQGRRGRQRPGDLQPPRRGAGRLSRRCTPIRPAGWRNITATTSSAAPAPSCCRSTISAISATR